MTTDEYDQLLQEIREARKAHRTALDEAIATEGVLNGLLVRLDQEESRIARQALSQGPIASRKLVVGG